MKYRYIIICALAALIAAFSGGDSSAQGVKHGSLIQSALVGNGDGLLIDAVQKYEDGQYQEAIALLDRIIKNSPDNDAAWYYKGLCGIKLKNASVAEEGLKKAVSLDSVNYWYRYMLAGLYGMTGRNDLTISMYESLLKDFPKRGELYYNLANLYINQNQMDQALKTIDDIETQFGKSDATVMTKFDILRHQKRDEEAFRALEEYNSEYSSPQVLTLLGDYQMSMYNDSTALTYYEEALSIDKDYAPALLGTAEVYRLTRKYPQYFEVMYGLMRDRDVRASAKSDYLQAVVRQSDPRFVRSFGPQFDSTMNIALEVHPSDTAILQTAGLYYFATGRTQKAESIYKNMMFQNPKSASAAAGYIQMLLTAQDWNKAVEVSDSVSAKFPSIPDFIEYSNIGKYNLKDYNGIISNCEKMLKVAPGDSAVALSAWSTMGDMHHQLGEQEKAYKAYDNALKVNPDYAPVLNNYAYFLSVQGKKLKKAYQMSKKTVEAEPDNATYLDTFGWILYLQGKALEAKPFFKHAMLYGGKESATMLEHYATVLDALGEKDLAKVYRQQAKTKAAEGKE